MWPEKIKDFVKSLIAKTEERVFLWDFDENNDCVVLKEKFFQVTLKYSYNGEVGMGEFVLFYYDESNHQYRFYTNQEWGDYDLAQRLFSSAQASKLQLPF